MYVTQSGVSGNTPDETIEFITFDRVRRHPKQRPLNLQVVKDYVKNWNPRLLEVATVRSLPGTTDVEELEGQHRREAAKQKGLHGYWCRVLHGVSDQEARDIIRGINTKRRNMDSVSLWKISIASDEPNALAIEAVLRTEGWSIISTKGKHTYPPKQTGALDMLKEIYGFGGSDFLCQVIQLVQCIPAMASQGPNEPVLGAVYRVLRYCGSHPNFDIRRFARRLCQFDLNYNLGRVASTTAGRQKIALSYYLLEEYNKALQDGRRVPASLLDMPLQKVRSHGK